MAAQLSPSSSSSSSTLSFSSDRYTRKCYCKQFSRVCYRAHSSIWVPKIFSRIHSRNPSDLNSSNGYPLNAVSLQDGSMSKPLAEEVPASRPGEAETTLSITVVGASGDLAKKKIFPALFALFYEDFLPENFIVFGYARTKMTDEELRNMISTTLTCRVDKRENCADKMEQFLMKCYYHSGQYSSEDDFAKLDCKLKEKEELLPLTMPCTEGQLAVHAMLLVGFCSSIDVPRKEKDKMFLLAEIGGGM